MLLLVEPPIERRRELLAGGFSDGELRQRLRVRELVTVRRGAYIAAGAIPDDPDARHVIRLCAALPDLAPDAVVSHVSAAVLHGLPVWNIPLNRVRVTRCRRAGARRKKNLHVHAAPLDPDERVEVGGVVMTSIARTVIDLARSVPFEEAVCVADAALFQRLVTRSDLDAALGRSERRPGNPQARRVVSFADGRSESVGESRSRVAIRRAGLPAPLLQWNLRSAAGGWLARVDFWWPELRTVGEFDGRAKYGRLLRPSQDPGEVAFQEKLREDALRAERLGMARWTWPELDDFTGVAGRLRRAFGWV